MKMGSSGHNTDRSDNKNKAQDSKKAEEVPDLENAALTSLKYLEDQKMLITGLQSGNIAFWEAETAKYIGSCTPFGSEEITNICPVQDIDYLFASTANGKIGLIAAPPLPYRFTKVLQWYNPDPETKTPSFINHMVWSDLKRLLFTVDEKSYIRVYDLTQVIEQIRQDRKAKQIKDDQGSKFRVSAPLLNKEDPKCLWVIKAHHELIRSIEYVDSEQILITSGLDKKVKIWDATTGTLIDSLQQKYDHFDPVPIAYKKPGFEGIWAPNLFDRVDKEYLQKKRREEQEAEERASENPFTKLMNAREADEIRNNSKILEKMNPMAKNHLMRGAQALMNPILKNQFKLGKMKTIPELNRELTKQKSVVISENEIDLNDPKIGQLLKHISETSPWLLNDPKKAIIEAEKEEFDPFYNYVQIETKELPSKTSTLWKVRITFEDNKKSFDAKLKEIINKVDEAEKIEESKEKKEGLMNKMEAFQADEHAHQPDKKEENEMPALLKKEKERIKATNENMKSVLTAHKQGHIMKGAIIKFDDTKFSDVQSKLYSELHRKELKGKMLDKNKPVVSLSKDEVDAAYKLAAALSNYDKDDLRNLKFLEIKTKEVNERQKSNKNFISLNREKVHLMTSPSKDSSR